MTDEKDAEPELRHHTLDTDHLDRELAREPDIPPPAAPAIEDDTEDEDDDLAPS